MMLTGRCAFALMTLLCAGLALAAIAGAEDARAIDIVAERFSFTPSEITLDQGEVVELRLTSDDTNHGFRVLGTDINVLIPKRGRGEKTVTFRAEKPGRYTFECSKLCGAGHNFMRGVIIVK